MARLIVLCKIQPSLTLRIYFFFYSFEITGSEDCLLENGLLDWVLLFDSTFCAKVREFKIYILLKMSSAPHLPRFPKDLSGLKTRSLTNFNDGGGGGSPSEVHILYPKKITTSEFIDPK